MPRFVVEDIFDTAARFLDGAGQITPQVRIAMWRHFGLSRIYLCSVDVACAQVGVPPHERCAPKNNEDAAKIARQTS